MFNFSSLFLASSSDNRLVNEKVWRPNPLSLLLFSRAAPRDEWGGEKNAPRRPYTSTHSSKRRCNHNTNTTAVSLCTCECERCSDAAAGVVVVERGSKIDSIKEYSRPKQAED